VTRIEPCRYALVTEKIFDLSNPMPDVVCSWGKTGFGAMHAGEQIRKLVVE
jgi:hypothetical protein